jgi:scyllo-inositol 2-dehydrogenase (NADP+)
MLNVAIVGFGLSGRYLQAPFFLANPNFNLQTIATSQDVALVYPSVKTAKDLDEILADKTIDLVSIASPNATHFEYAKKTLLAGKHVLVEKPFTATAAEAEELIALAKKQEKVIAIFQNRRFDSDFMTVKKLIESKVLGEILTFEINFERFKPALNPKKWKEVVGLASGIIYDLGSHIIDQVICLFGYPKVYSGKVYTEREGSQIDDAFHINLDYGTMQVVLRSSLLVEKEGPRYHIKGTKSSFTKFGIDVQEDHLKAGLMPKMPGFGVEPIENQGVLDSKTSIETEVGNWDFLFQNLYESIAENKELLIKPEEVLEQIRIIEKVRG